MKIKINLINLLPVIVFSLFIVSCTENKSATQSVNITLAAEMSLLPATVWIANSKGYFKKHGVSLTIKEFDSGRNALESMLKDESIDISTVAQTPVVFNSFNNESYVIVAMMAYSLDDMKLLARRDHGIAKPEELVGKKIGVTVRSTGHYFLEGFLAHYGYTLDDVIIHDINASSLKDKLMSGEMDAITSWEPHIFNTEKQMGSEKIKKLISPTPFRKDFYFTVSQGYANKHQDRIKRFLKAVLEAEKFIKNQPTEAQNIIAKRLNIDVELVKNIWEVFSFEITLEQSILVNLEDEADWARKFFDKNKNIPNYLNFIDMRPLLAVKSDRVTLIH